MRLHTSLAVFEILTSVWLRSPFFWDMMPVHCVMGFQRLSVALP